MFRTLATISIALMMAGCISTPNTKALITPLGGIGIHSFAPQRDPNRLPPSDAAVAARIAANEQACAPQEPCASLQ